MADQANTVSRQRFEGETPNGGAYAVVVRDGDRVEITEFSEDDEVVSRTYGTAPAEAAS